MLDRLPATDAADRVDWHWRWLIGGAALSTSLVLGAELAAPDRVDVDGRVVIATRESLQEAVK